MEDSFTPENIAAREALWTAHRDGGGLTLTQVEVTALWDSVLKESLELAKLRGEVHAYRFADPTIRTEAVRAALELVLRSGKTAMRDEDGTPSRIASIVAYSCDRGTEAVQQEIDRYAEKCLA